MISSGIFNPFTTHSAFLLAALVAISPISVFAQYLPAAKAPESTAAVWDMENLSKSTLSDETVGAITQYIRAKIFNIMPDYRWLDRGNVAEILDEQKFQSSGCTNQNCVVELGQLLGARKMVTGSVSKAGGTYNLTLSVIDIETGLIDKSVSEICPNCTEGQLYQLAEKAVLAMSGKPSRTPYTPDHQRVPTHKGRINFDFNYPGAGLRYFLSDKVAVEARGQHLSSGTNNHFSTTVLGARLYRYISGPSRNLRPYFCLEGDHIIFKGAHSSGNGAVAGAFSGIEYFFGGSLSAQTDLGVAYIAIRDDETALTESGADYVMNFGINIYFN